MLSRNCIEVLPATAVLLRPRETVDMSLFYRPSERMRPWSEPLVVEVDGVTMTLLTLTGACQGTEVVLASDSLPFGPVALGSSTSKRLALENTGKL
jgi:hydrocephalus-inducing protein